MLRLGQPGMSQTAELVKQSSSGEIASQMVCMPLKQLNITSSFGWRIHPLSGDSKFHQGIDLFAKSEMVYSVMNGTVSCVGNHPSLGRFISIKHQDLECIYGHLSVVTVTAGQIVHSGQPIAITGSTGKATGEHLHFAIRYSGKYIHPLRCLMALASGK